MNNEATVKKGMSTHARMLIAIAMCAAMALAVFGTTGVFAADDDGAVKPGYTEEELSTLPEDAIRVEATGDFEGSSLSVRTSEAGTEYSVDGGKTWTAEVPDGVTVDESGTGEAPADDSGFSLSKGI
jgi:hypothetical protein